ncbi:MAG: pyridoxine 5'-phosphate synthase [Candidatus Thioglobus sp.]|nr:pyridoxine 5'-phosphate synthase [Candidatus Thioglobus sp.]
MSIYLGVNIDHIATLRQARGAPYPSPIEAALLCEKSGADSITLHLREDRRHIQDSDVELLRYQLATKMNLEMAATAEMLRIAGQIKPNDCCLVPEKREELTTEGGLDVASKIPKMTDICAELAAANITVSLFIDAQKQQIDAAKTCGAPVIELHTGHYADAANEMEKLTTFEQIKTMAKYANSLGLQVNAGHPMPSVCALLLAKFVKLYLIGLALKPSKKLTLTFSQAVEL